MEEREALRSAVPAQGLNAAIPGGGKLLDLAGRILDISSAGLTARNCLNSSGDNESGFLDPLREIVASGKTMSEVLLDKYNGEWGGDVRRVYDEMSF
jgi:glutamate--cysteine ligase